MRFMQLLDRTLLKKSQMLRKACLNSYKIVPDLI